MPLTDAEFHQLLAESDRLIAEQKRLLREQVATFPEKIAVIDQKIESLETWAANVNRLGMFMALPPLPSGGYARSPDPTVVARCEKAVQDILTREARSLRKIRQQAVDLLKLYPPGSPP